jgi:hypothetical protein
LSLLRYLVLAIIILNARFTEPLLLFLLQATPAFHPFFLAAYVCLCLCFLCLWSFF